MNDGSAAAAHQDLRRVLDHLNAALAILDETGTEPDLGAHVDFAAQRVAARLASHIPAGAVPAGSPHGV